MPGARVAPFNLTPSAAHQHGAPKVAGDPEGIRGIRGMKPA